MIRSIALCVVFASVLLMSCTKSLTPEEQAQVQALHTELEATKKEVAAAEAQNSQYSSGLVKVLVTLRLELLKTNEALIQQRIHAIESGAKVTVETVATNPAPERAKELEAELTKQQVKVTEAEANASLYSGGLVGAMAMMGAATEQNTLAMLRQQYLVAKYGLAALPQEGSVASTESAAQLTETSSSAAPPAADDDDQKLREEILDATLLRKHYAKQDYQDYVFLDVAFNAKGLDKPARAIKGVLWFTDLFGERKLALKWTIEEPIVPGITYTEEGGGFKYNQFTDSHHWVRNTAKENMKVVFRVDNILYEDGGYRSFDD